MPDDRDIEPKPAGKLDAGLSGATHKPAAVRQSLTVASLLLIFAGCFLFLFSLWYGINQQADLWMVVIAVVCVAAGAYLAANIRRKRGEV